ncbi:MAG: ComEC/Rec2 family competence protein [Allomuricauda sp.]
MSIKLTLCLIVGIVLGFHLGIAPEVPFYVLLLLLPLLYWGKEKQLRENFPYFELTTILATVLLGIMVVGLATSKTLGQHYSHQNLGKEKLWHLKVREVLKPNPYTQRYVAQVVAIEGEKSLGRVLLVIPTDSTAKKLKVDDELIVLSKAKTIDPPLNPYQFNYKDYLKKLGIYHQIRTKPNGMELMEHAPKTLLGMASNFREYSISKLKKQDFGEDELAVIQALLLGQRDDISENTYNNYKNAGAVHILAVSGLHVGILLFLMQFLLSPLDRFPKGKVLKLAIIVGLLWAYAFVAGLSPSIVRAVTMFSFVAYALYLNRPTNSFNIIALSMLFILLVKPLMLFQVGFQMSYAAVLSIVWIYPKLQRFWFPDNIIVRKTWQLLSVSVAAQLGVLPVSLYYFHQFPSLFFISNLLIIPFLGLILGLGVLIVVLSTLDQLPIFLVQAYNWIIKMMNSIVEWVGQQEGFIIKDIPFDGFQMVISYVIIIFLVVFLSKPQWKTAMFLAMGVIGLQGYAIWNQYTMTSKERLLLLHSARNTALLHQTGHHLDIYAKDTANLNRIVKDYKVAERIKTSSYPELKNSYTLNGKELYILDSLGIYPDGKQHDFILLTQSPKINLERLLDSIHPKKILADGSNYRSYVDRWKETCAKKGIPFHYTGEKGAYYFK